MALTELEGKLLCNYVAKRIADKSKEGVFVIANDMCDLIKGDEAALKTKIAAFKIEFKAGMEAQKATDEASVAQAEIDLAELE